MANNQTPQPGKGAGASPPVSRGTTGLNIVVDKVDEIAAYMAAIRDPGRLNSAVPFQIVPEGMKILDVERHMPNPSRIRKHPKFVDLDSFTTYVNVFKVGYEPRLMAKLSPDGLSLRCIFDYDMPAVHHAAKPGAVIQEEGKPDMREPDVPESVELPVPLWSDHNATMDMKFSEDYAALKAIDNKWMDQEDFALFIEENTHLFFDPNGADMLEMAQDMRGTINVDWTRGKRLSNGRTELVWSETVGANGSKGAITVPETLLLACPIFEGFVVQPFKAAFRWRLTEQKSIKFSLRLLTKQEERKAQETVKTKVAADTGLKLLNVSTFDVTPDRR